MLTGIIGSVGPAYGKPRLREATGDNFEGGNHQPSLRETIGPVDPAYGKQRLREPTGDNFEAENHQPSLREPMGTHGNQRDIILRPRITSP